MFLILIGAVIFFAASLDLPLARGKVLPGSTAVWALPLALRPQWS
jgi:hypothetical protein